MPSKFCLHFFQLCLIICAWGLHLEVLAQNIPQKPEPARYVNDLAAMLESNEGQLLEIKLKKYYDSTSTQIVIVTIQTLDGYSIDDYAQKLAENWGIGQKGKDNGLLILVSQGDRKMKIATGYGLEAKITDLTAKQIIDNQLVPNFKTENYYYGLNEAIEVIFKLLSGEFTASDLAPPPNMADFFFYAYRVVMILGFLLGSIFTIFILDELEAKYPKLRPYRVGIIALSLLPMLLSLIYLLYVYRAWGYFPLVLLIYGIFGLIMWFISHSAKGGNQSYSSGKNSSSYTGSSGSYSDSSSSYSDSSFGGGSFGGGGASGSW
jgi:uncharacterized membrane protein YgcG